MLKPFENSVRISASLSATWSTPAMRGPRRSSPFNALSWAVLPMAYTSTRPSNRFFTYPATPNRAATLSAKKRKPTPCTAPDTKNRLAKVSTTACHTANFLRSRAIVAEVAPAEGRKLRAGPSLPQRYLQRSKCCHGSCNIQVSWCGGTLTRRRLQLVPAGPGFVAPSARLSAQ